MKFRKGTVELVQLWNNTTNALETVPYSVENEEKLYEKYNKLNLLLSAHYGSDHAVLVSMIDDGNKWDAKGSSKASKYDVDNHEILIKNKYSLLTFLRCFAQSRGREDAREWANELFVQAFPEKYGMLVSVGNQKVEA